MPTDRQTDRYMLLQLMPGISPETRDYNTMHWKLPLQDQTTANCNQTAIEEFEIDTQRLHFQPVKGTFWSKNSLHVQYNISSEVGDIPAQW